MREGFKNVYHNYHHSPLLYSPTEILVRNILIELGFKEGKDFFHEYKIKTEDSKGKKSNYWADFFFKNKKLDLEIDPAFHTTYKPYLYKCIRRTKLLKKKGIITKRLKININRNRINPSLEIIKYKIIRILSE